MILLRWRGLIAAEIMRADAGRARVHGGPRRDDAAARGDDAADAVGEAGFSGVRQWARGRGRINPVSARVVCHVVWLCRGGGFGGGGGVGRVRDGIGGKGIDASGHDEGGGCGSGGLPRRRGHRDGQRRAWRRAAASGGGEDGGLVAVGLIRDVV